jgi:hypothetical protein
MSKVKVKELCYDWWSVIQSVLVSSTHLGLTTRFQTVAGLLMWGTLSDERTSLPFTIAAESESCATHDHILLSQIQDSSNLEGQVPIFISHRNRVGQLYPQALGSLFIASYNLQGYSGGIQTCHHEGSTNVKVKVTSQLMVSQSVSPGVWARSGRQEGSVLYILLAQDRRGSVFCICCWPLPGQSQLLSQIWDFCFCHLVQLTGLGWKYLTPPLRG